MIRDVLLFGTTTLKRVVRDRRWDLGVMVLAAIVIAEALLRMGAFGVLDQRVQDAYFQWQGKRAEPAHVAIVVLDEATLAAYPDDPLVFWTPRYAKAIATLRAAGAQVVGLDMLLSVSPERWLGGLGGNLREVARDYDQPFREQINSGQLVLGATRTGPGGQASDYLLPSPDYLLALPNFDVAGYVGLADLFDEGDGIIRGYRVAPVDAGLREAVSDSVPVLGMAPLLAVKAVGGSTQAASWSLGGRDIRRDQPAEPIRYLGPPGTFPQLPLLRLLADGALQDPEVRALRGKVVLIGATAPGLNDDHFTPYATRLVAGRGRLMNGVELHANVVEAMLRGDRLTPQSGASRIVLLCVATILLSLLFIALPTWVGALIWLGCVVLAVGLGYLSFINATLVSVTTYVTAGGLAFIGVLRWRLSGEERERARVRRMFGFYVSEEVVSAVLQAGGHPELGGQVQTMTVLFSDIRNFTTISERLAAKEVVDMLNTYFERACAPLLAEGGRIDKFIGDAIMVEFGSPLPAADHARRALRAALALNQVALDFAGWVNERFPGRDLPDFAIGIGVHSGEAVVGNIGSRRRMEFTAIGDTVNLASRLEGKTKELGCAILASDATLVAAGPGVSCGRDELIQVKGRAQPIRVFEVLRVDDSE